MKKEIKITETNRKFEVYEDNGGGLTLFIFDEEGKSITYAHSGYEYNSGQLERAINAIIDGDIDFLEEWEGNGFYDGIQFNPWESIGLSLNEIYESSILNDELVMDNDGVYRHVMGSNARGELKEFIPKYVVVTGSKSFMDFEGTLLETNDLAEAKERARDEVYYINRDKRENNYVFVTDLLGYEDGNYTPIDFE
jgi:hypothetical protein